MRLDELTPAHVRRAVEVYLRHTYPPGLSSRPRTSAANLTGATTMDETFARMDRQRATDVEGCKRYSLQLGNHRYPFMKLVLEEYLVNGEYFFAVDTHDDLDIRPDNPEYGQWQQLKQHNRALKHEIESAWRIAGLPTLDDLRMLCEDLSSLEREEQKAARILLVEDDLAVAFAIRAWLIGKGYQVEIADSGEATLARLARDPLPDLVVLDYELPGLDGEAVLDRMRADPRTAGLAVLMATAATIDLSRLGRVNGVLHKPYPRELLMATIRRLLPTGTRR